ncbi:MAG: hypothetical protein WCO26_11105 [Deltaproteobacteria bacterium]
MKQILQKVAVAKKADLEAWETALRAAVLSCGGKILAGLLEGIGSGRSSGRCFVSVARGWKAKVLGKTNLGRC